MNIGIFETEHFEGTYPVIKLFDTPGNKLILFTNIETYRRLNDLFKTSTDKYEWVITGEEKNRFVSFFKLYSAVKKHQLQLLYINTISNNHLLYAMVLKLLPSIRVVVTVHDINCLFESKFKLRFREGIQHVGKKLLVQYVKEFNVVSDTMIPYLITKNNHKIIHNVPGAVFENRIRKNHIAEHLHLVVPGTIDNRRRDYEKIFLLLNEAEAIGLSIQVTLLGGPQGAYGASIISRAKQFKGKCTKLFFFDQSIVDQDEFDAQLDMAHFIFIPSVVHTTICNEIPEIYGVTKSSGNIFDVIKHAKPFIVPDTLVFPADLGDSCFQYDSVPKLITFLQSIIHAPEQYEVWRDNAIKNSEKYTVEKIRNKNKSLFDNNY